MEKFEVNDFVENEDGTADITITMDYDTLLLFARKGVIATIRESAEKVLEENVPYGSRE